MLTADLCTCTAAVGSAIGTAVGMSVSVTFVMSFSMGVLVASVLSYISRRSEESSHKPSSNADPATVYDEVGTNKNKIFNQNTHIHEDLIFTPSESMHTCVQWSE